MDYYGDKFGTFLCAFPTRFPNARFLSSRRRECFRFCFLLNCRRFVAIVVDDAPNKKTGKFYGATFGYNMFWCVLELENGEEKKSTCCAK